MNKKIKYKELSNRWLKIHKQNIKESSFQYYKTILNNHLIPELGDLEVYKITNIMVQELIIDKSKHGNIKSKSGLSYNTLRDIVLIFKQTINFATKHNYINKFDLSFSIPKSAPTQIETLCQEDQKKLFNYLVNNNSHKNIGVLLSLLTGIRIGEICALTFGDIDFKNSIISINKTGQRIQCEKGTKIVISTPKTHSSIRKLPIDNSIGSLLMDLYTHDSDFIISGSSKFIEPRVMRSHLQKICTNIGIKYIKFHSLRHTFATECISIGCDYKTVSDILGHSNITTTINLYVHPKIENKKKVQQLLMKQYINH